MFLVFYNYPAEIYTLYPISYPIEGSLRKRGNLAQTSKLLKVCKFNYASVLYRAAPSLLPLVHRYHSEARKYIFTAYI